ncbi:MAG: mannose-1-phosphate guanylyltransferase [Clostridiaceae bacterium]|nr:mannose-1-phosphate guanylyltransferase [Clostridiaceae bacterium]
MLCALIMCGGKGERFWPLSTDEKPKQFLKLLGEDTMLQMTVNRLLGLIPIEQIFIVTDSKYVQLVKEQLKNIPSRNIIEEPVGKNTAPCIALSAFIIDRYYKNAIITVVPSDHLIKNEEKFLEVINCGYEFISMNNDAVITIGIKPDRAETGYGYIKYNLRVDEIDPQEIYSVEKFVEKPDLDTAIAYLEEGSYLWNAGMFIWNVNTILKLNEKYLPLNYEMLLEIAVSEEKDFSQVLHSNYERLESISVDYGIMEKAEKIYVIEGDFGWDDVGTWNSVERIRAKDRNGNVSTGETKSIDGKNNILISSNKKIVLVGLSNIFVVESDELIFIGSKDSIKDIKEIKNLVS